MKLSKAEKIRRGMMLGLPRPQAQQLSTLSTPEEIQDFVGRIPMNFEIGGGTALSVTETLKQRRAHCIEAAMVAACALHMNGHPPFLMDMGAAEGDVDHVIALFKRGAYWGAISKSNGAYLRYRDPIFRTLRELALSYFAEYTKGRKKTLRTYSVPVDLRRTDPKLWVTHPNFCSEIVDILTTAKHFDLVPRGQEKRIRLLDPIECAAYDLDEYKNPRKKKHPAHSWRGKKSGQ
ncbi:MAG: hypothetical protein JNM81_18045 [Rhodospirillaceae bacterium]|nr:hypothetical protein [Rhodospirillaceae bacterium]